ncbi:RNA-binding domain-containing protein [Ruegeria sp. Ofav3-42]|uniref:RNA-binding domain-containing protein n=1 Tax=Ruegeria sp. Ofav3-42 TaxID=2917759 RepID=UPI001EF6C64A|nr:RNA-binding domain-containing protein [Ruegeria sp. Ofav3-42]MCG7519502.1 putative DNA binding domain-containing protein [Ruegeria sp. Ofav3-42]
MKEENKNLFKAICDESLPSDFDELFGEIYDQRHDQFKIQENSLLDYKEHLPAEGDLNYRSGLLKLVAAFHNMYGGLILFGIRDVDFKPVGVEGEFDVEKYNALYSEIFGNNIEIIKKSYNVNVGGMPAKIIAVLVPRRSTTRPAVAHKNYGQILKGNTYIRERHEAKVANSRHYPILFSRREILSDESGEDIIGLQYYAPPSPSTLPTFIGRDFLAFKLWDWLLIDKKPRIYLSGAGGSGKSTLAYEFMDQVARNWTGLKLRNSETIDFVAFVSAKETELDVRSGVEQKYSLRQFEDAEGLFKLILTNVGGEEPSNLEGQSRESLLEKIELLFDSFNGLIVIDDIDALSRAGRDTGEEDLFLLSSQAQKIVKIVYTLRNDASYAMNAAIPVPGLDEETEVPAFVDACCELFNTERPNSAQLVELVLESSRLPLLIETIIGLRTNGSSYEQAIRDFRERGGDAARSYLYQREYEKLSAKGKSRQVLATLMQYERPLSFDSICALTNTMETEGIRSAINETANIFLKVSSAEDGTTAYSLSPSAAGFVRAYSERLPYFPAICRAIDHFRKDTATSTPREASIISKAEHLLRSKQYDSVVSLSNGLDASDTVRVNPKFMAIYGRALVQASSADLVKARDLFRSASNFGFDDIFMLRAWYHAERKSGYRFAEAIEVCQLVVDNPKYSSRHRSEFSSKIGECKSTQARSISGTDNPDKVRLYADAVLHYSWALHFADSANEIDQSMTLDWLSRALQGYITCSGGDFRFLLNAFEAPIKAGIVFGAEASKVFQVLISGASRTRDVKTLRKFQGTLNTGINAITRFSGKKHQSNVRPLLDALNESKKSFEIHIMQLTG